MQVTKPHDNAIHMRDCSVMTIPVHVHTITNTLTHPHIYVFVCVAKLNWKRREELKRQIYGDTDALE